MMKKQKTAKTLSLLDFMELFPNEAAAVKFTEECLWTDGKPICPHCGRDKTFRIPQIHGHRCKSCVKNFTVRIGTIFENSRLPMRKWLLAMCSVQQSRKGISSIQLSKELGIGQKAAWFLGHRLRELCVSRGPLLEGVVEVDETYIGGKEGNKHANKRTRGRQGGAGKTVLIGARARSGETRMAVIQNKNCDTMCGFIAENVKRGATIFTDEHWGYAEVRTYGYRHRTVNHSKHVYAIGKVNTNSIEAGWALMKRGIYGVYHHVDPRHLHRYANEVTFRLDQGNREVDTIDHIKAMVRAAPGRRLTYDELTQKAA